jgi:hypothetical protein
MGRSVVMNVTRRNASSARQQEPSRVVPAKTVTAGNVGFGRLVCPVSAPVGAGLQVAGGV